MVTLLIWKISVVLSPSPCERFHVWQFCKLEYIDVPGSIRVIRGSLSCSFGVGVDNLSKMSVKISPTSWVPVLSDCGKIDCRLSNVSGPFPLTYLSRFDCNAWICWSPGMWVIEGMWKYSCIATLMAHLPPELVMPRGGGAPGILHVSSCFLTFCFDPPSPVILRLFGCCPPSLWVGSLGRSYVSFCLPWLTMV